MENVDKILEIYKEQVGLPHTVDHDFDTRKYFLMSRDQLKNLTIDQCSEAVVLLNSLAYHVQMEHNTQLSISKWAKHTCLKYVADKAPNYYGSWDQKNLMAINDDSHATKLDEIATQGLLRADQLHYSANAIRFLSDSILNLQKTKYGKLRHE